MPLVDRKPPCDEGRACQPAHGARSARCTALFGPCFSQVHASPAVSPPQEPRKRGLLGGRLGQKALLWVLMVSDP